MSEPVSQCSCQCERERVSEGVDKMDSEMTGRVSAEGGILEKNGDVQEGEN